eukprot:CAMPEP_0178636450 /NCGR_PEP_ID=MMETSP0698-20121128/13744_1 /TAXON_ID=265572 /ORGANISM="Extubocellulus spinifer, Strain CCMP396" /LENGTH=51 /DNA_ID=CAMNT_0020276333 /DNA_START=164 /DNA_END=316 /DNA_ORIENTATION=+
MLRLRVDSEQAPDESPDGDGSDVSIPASPEKIILGMTPWTPQLPSTSCVMP